MEVTSSILNIAAKALADLVRDRLKQRAADKKQQAISVSAPEALEYHLQGAANWSADIQLYGMTSPADTDSDTIALSFDTPRRFRSDDFLDRPIQESDILKNERHMLVLGDPGSGKTTTVKRIIRQLLLEPQSSGATTIFQYPVVIRLREEQGESSLYNSLAKCVGIATLDREAILRNSSSSQLARETSLSVPFERQLSEFFDNSRAVILLDGLDELPSYLHSQYMRDIKALAIHLSVSKIIITCRSGYRVHLDGFDVFEICPLEPDQIQAIAHRWLPSKADLFLRELQRLPYHDIANRPLLVANLIILFKKYGRLPVQPAEVYEKVVVLMIEEWDARREIVRSSKYSEFSADRKARFLAALAYQLTCKIERKVFSPKHLVEAYLTVHKSYGLPATEAEEVAAEIETHTGLIIKSGDAYEFSHLSIQEYLCAAYLVRTPFPELLPQYARNYPAPIAIAVALSSDPTGWLAALFLKKRDQPFVDRTIEVFLRRLLIERPCFQSSPLFAVALGKVIHDFGRISAVREYASDLLSNESGLESAILVLECYRVTELSVPTSVATVIKYLHVHNEYGFNAPAQISLPLQLLELLLERGVAIPCLQLHQTVFAKSSAELLSLCDSRHGSGA